jgi:hypothetical protein
VVVPTSGDLFELVNIWGVFSPRPTQPEQSSIIKYWMWFHATGREIQVKLVMMFGEDAHALSTVDESIRALRCGRTPEGHRSKN